MAQIIREITIDVSQTNNLRAITAKQNDLNSRFLKINITDEGNPLLVDASSTITMNVKRTDNQVKLFYGSVNDDGSITVPLTPWMLELEGSINCDVSVISIDANQKLTTMQFSIYVQAAIFTPSTLEESDEYDVLVELLAAAEKAEECAQATEEAKEATEMAQQAASGVKIVEQNGKSLLTFWVGTQEEYDAIVEKETGCFYIISDDGELAALYKDMNSLSNKMDAYHTPYDISSAVIPKNSGDTYKLIKYGRILFLSYNVYPVSSEIAGGSSKMWTLQGNICTIEGYVPVVDSCTQIAPLATRDPSTPMSTVQISIDESGKNTVLKMPDDSLNWYYIETSDKPVCNITAMFISTPI